MPSSSFLDVNISWPFSASGWWLWISWIFEKLFLHSSICFDDAWGMRTGQSPAHESNARHLILVLMLFISPLIYMLFTVFEWVEEPEIRTKQERGGKNIMIIKMAIILDPENQEMRREGTKCWWWWGKKEATRERKREGTLIPHMGWILRWWCMPSSCCKMTTRWMDEWLPG